MKPYVGWWDRLFGKRVHIQITRSDGSPALVEVTRAWLDKAVSEGAMSPEPDSAAHAAAQSQPRDGPASGAAIEDLCKSIGRVLEVDRALIRRGVGTQSQRPLEFWLCIAPQVLFHDMLVNQEAATFPVPLLQQMSTADAEKCASVTQAYCALLLHRMLTNSVQFREQMGIAPDQIEELFATTLRGDASDEFRRYLALSSVPHGMPDAVDPRDWPLKWFWDIADILIPDEDAQVEALGEWNDNIIARLDFVSREMRLVGPLREHAVTYVRTGTVGSADS